MNLIIVSTRQVVRIDVLVVLLRMMMMVIIL